MLQNEYFRILKTDRSLIVNDFDKPYIAIVFASWHLQVNTRIGSESYSDRAAMYKPEHASWNIQVARDESGGIVIPIRK